MISLVEKLIISKNLVNNTKKHKFVDELMYYFCLDDLINHKIGPNEVFSNEYYEEVYKALYNFLNDNNILKPGDIHNIYNVEYFCLRGQKPNDKNIAKAYKICRNWTTLDPKYDIWHKKSASLFIRGNISSVNEENDNIEIHKYGPFGGIKICKLILK